MRTITALLAAFAMCLLATPALAIVTPISGTPIVLEHDPAGIIANGTTTKDGSITMGKLAPGSYALVVSGKVLAAALARIAPSSSSGTITVSITIDGKKADTTYPYQKGVQTGLRIPFAVPRGAAGAASGKFVFTPATI